MRELLIVFAALFCLAAMPTAAMPTALCQERLVTASDVAEVARPSSADLAGLVKLQVGQKFSASDSIRLHKDDSPDAMECLEGLIWNSTDFSVWLEDGQSEHRSERTVRFPSPMPQGEVVNDLVAMEWYVAFDDSGRPKKAPAMVVVHESGSGMTVGRMVAKGLRAHGLHTFMLQMPGYGMRKGPHAGNVENLLPSMKQAISDVRRARDAVAALPLVDTEAIGLQGTSLGGFVTATVSGLDQAYDRAFILLAGGDLNRVIFDGAKDAANVRKRLDEAGVTKEMIMENTRQIEPLRLAHRIRPESTWLFSGKFDDVVPPECSHALAKAAGLPSEHHVEMPVDHYSGVILMPKVLLDIAKTMKSAVTQ
jgi:dienelactone hydrolase